MRACAHPSMSLRMEKCNKVPDFQPSYLQRSYPDRQQHPPRDSERGRLHAEREAQTPQPPAPAHARARPSEARRYQRPEDVAETKPNRWRFDDLRSRDADPVERAPNEPTGRGVTGFNWRSALLVAESTALGLGCVQIADQKAFHGDSFGTNIVFFWCGLILVFLPTAIRAIMRRTPRAERIAMILLLAIALYVIKIENSPYVFTYNDEYIHWVNTQHILDNGHIFQYNPLLPTAAYYPGLAAVAATLVRLTGLSIFVSGLIIIGAARIIISACLYLVAERMTGSSRAAAVASIIYAANPMFLFWSSQFAYESLGLPLAAFTVWWLYTTRKNEGRAAQIVTVLAIGAVTVTHHISAFALTGILAMWFFAELIAQKPREQRRYVGAFTLLAGSDVHSMVFLRGASRSRLPYWSEYRADAERNHKTNKRPSRSTPVRRRTCFPRMVHAAGLCCNCSHYAGLAVGALSCLEYVCALQEG